jgi:hypothetical protein
LTVAERAGRGLDDALAAIAAAAQVGHQRAEMIGHHAAYFCRREMLDAAASNHVEEALTLAQRLGARRFEAEALACRGELRRVALAEGEALLAAHVGYGEARRVSSWSQSQSPDLRRLPGFKPMAEWLKDRAVITEVAN